MSIPATGRPPSHHASTSVPDLIPDLVPAPTHATPSHSSIPRALGASPRIAKASQLRTSRRHHHFTTNMHRLRAVVVLGRMRWVRSLVGAGAVGKLACTATCKTASGMLLVHPTLPPATCHLGTPGQGLYRCWIMRLNTNVWIGSIHLLFGSWVYPRPRDHPHRPTHAQAPLQHCHPAMTSRTSTPSSPTRIIPRLPFSLLV